MPDIRIAIGPDEQRYFRWIGGDEIRIEGEYGYDESTFTVSLRGLKSALKLLDYCIKSSVEEKNMAAHYDSSLAAANASAGSMVPDSVTVQTANTGSASNQSVAPSVADASGAVQSTSK